MVKETPGGEMLNEERFFAVMTGLGELYNKKISEFILALYYDIFKDYTIEQFENAVKRCLKDKVYNTIPKPAEIIEYLEGTKDDKALTGWLQVQEAIQKGGSWASVEFAEPIISNCVNELGGWLWLCQQPKDQTPFIEKRFMDLYRLLLKRGISKGQKLIGTVEAGNREGGFLNEIPKPLRIGFDDSVKKIEERQEK